jgi:hypothetical protein
VRGEAVPGRGARQRLARLSMRPTPMATRQEIPLRNRNRPRVAPASLARAGSHVGWPALGDRFWCDAATAVPGNRYRSPHATRAGAERRPGRKPPDRHCGGSARRGVVDGAGHAGLVAAVRANQVRRRETARGPSRYKSRCPQVAVLDFVAGNLRRKERPRKLSDQQRVFVCSAPSSATAAP